jgi:hypothetical protein
MGIQKAVAIDGVNFLTTHRGLGVREINYKHFMHVMAHGVGTAIPLQCHATINPGLCHPHRRLYCDMKGAGILPSPAKSHGSFDDALVKTWLHQFCSRAEMKEMVLVTCDHDLIEEALWLLTWHVKHFHQQLDLYVIATAMTCRGDYCPTRGSVIKEIQRTPHAHFVEMSAIVHQSAMTGVCR